MFLASKISLSITKIKKMYVSCRRCNCLSSRYSHLFILRKPRTKIEIKHLSIYPAAPGNGLVLLCAFYQWLPYRSWNGNGSIGSARLPLEARLRRLDHVAPSAWLRNLTQDGRSFEQNKTRTQILAPGFMTKTIPANQR